MSKLAKHREAARRHYHNMTAHLLGLPADNYWCYPIVYYWERDETGAYVVPATLAFNVDPSIYWVSERKDRLFFLLLQNTGVRWDINYDYLPQGFIVATRLSHSITVQEPEGNKFRYIQFASHDIDVTTFRVPLLRRIYRGLIHDDWRSVVPIEAEER